jgi:hypothetical protein
MFRYELLGDQDGVYQDSQIGTWGVGQGSFAYDECCLNVLDISAITNRRLIRRFPEHACQTVNQRAYNASSEGLRFTIPIDSLYEFPTLELRPEVSDPGKVYAPESRGLINDVYNPPYFAELPKGFDLSGPCNDVAETDPGRGCFSPMYGHGCLNANTPIYAAPVAFWSSRFGDRIPDVPGGVAARNAFWGFEPVFFKPLQVKAAVNLIIFEEWKLPPIPAARATRRR